nr:hypothetical protein [Tanacetum cinerariifolium]
AAKAQNWKLPVCYDDDDDEERSDSLDNNIISGLPPSSAITSDKPVLSTEEPDNSLSMGDEHLDTILTTELDEFIKSGVENLIPIPSESEGIPDHMCDVPFLNNSSPLDISKDQFEDFSESNEEFSLIDDDSFSIDIIDYVEASPLDSELVSSEVMEIVIPKVGGIKASNDNPIPFYDPIIPGTPLNLNLSRESDFFLETKSSSTSLNSLLEETHNFDNSLPEFTTFSKVLFDAEYESDSSDDQLCSDEDVLETIVLKPLCEEEIIPMESLRTHDSSLPISSKIDSLLGEFAGKLTLLKSIPPRIDETDYDFEEDIHLIEKLLYDNSSLRPPKEFVSANSDAATEKTTRWDDVLFSLDNEDKVFNLGILSHKKSVKIITRVTQEKKLSVFFASWLFEDFDPPFYELLVFKEVPNSMRLLLFSSKNEEKVFKPGIYTFKKVHCCFLSELSHPVGSSVGRNDGTARPESNYGNTADIRIHYRHWTHNDVIDV